MGNRWHRLEHLIIDLAKESGFCHAKVYGDLILEEERQFDRYLLNYTHARMEDSFFYSSLGRIRKQYKEMKK